MRHTPIRVLLVLILGTDTVTAARTTSARIHCQRGVVCFVASTRRPKRRIAPKPLSNKCALSGFATIMICANKTDCPQRLKIRL